MRHPPRSSRSFRLLSRDPDPTDPPYPGEDPPSLTVAVNKLLDAEGTTRRLLGVNRSGGEFTGVQGRGVVGNSAGCPDIHASCQKPMPDARYSPAFWTSVASTFKDDPAVVLDLFNEPYPSRAAPTTEQA